MKKSSIIIWSLPLFLSALQAVQEERYLSASELESSFEIRGHNPLANEEPFLSQEQGFSPFTGQIKKSKVRLRLHPSLDSEVVQELSEGDLLVVTGEQGNFYEVKPLGSVKGYVFRTYLLDGQIEGNRVNVRLAPTTDSPVLIQLHSGDKVDGEVSKENSKWYQISLPDQTRFYIAKEYVRNIGDPSFFSSMKTRLGDAQEKLAKAYGESINTLRQDFPTMNPELVRKQFIEIINEYKDFPEYVEKAKKHLQTFEDKYLEHKVAYLESNHNFEEFEDSENSPMLKEAVCEKPFTPQDITPISQPYWEPIEENYYQSWLETHPDGSMEDFYADTARFSTVLRGIVKPYGKDTKNKPGDFLLVTQFDRPIAFLYSTKLNLQGLVGQRVQVRVVERPNNHFAFPAYFVLSVE